MPPSTSMPPFLLSPYLTISPPLSLPLYLTHCPSHSPSPPHCLFSLLSPTPSHSVSITFIPPPSSSHEGNVETCQQSQTHSSNSRGNRQKSCCQCRYSSTKTRNLKCTSTRFKNMDFKRKFRHTLQRQ